MCFAGKRHLCLPSHTPFPSLSLICLLIPPVIHVSPDPLLDHLVFPPISPRFLGHHLDIFLLRNSGTLIPLQPSRLTLSHWLVPPPFHPLQLKVHPIPSSLYPPMIIRLLIILIYRPPGPCHLLNIITIHCPQPLHHRAPMFPLTFQFTHL